MIVVFSVRPMFRTFRSRWPTHVSTIEISPQYEACAFLTISSV